MFTVGEGVRGENRKRFSPFQAEEGICWAYILLPTRYKVASTVVLRSSRRLLIGASLLGLCRINRRVTVSDMGGEEARLPPLV